MKLAKKAKEDKHGLLLNANTKNIPIKIPPNTVNIYLHFS